MTTDLERCIGFLHEAAFACARRTEESPFGTALFDDDLPRVWSLNYFLAHRNLETASAQLLAAEADRLLGGAGLGHRKVEVYDDVAGPRLEPHFAKLGWVVECDLVMVARHPSADDDGEADVLQLSADELAPVWAEGIRSEPAGRDEEVVRELVEHKRVLTKAIDTQFLGARVDGQIASYCDLYSGGGTGQIEAVMTLERFRNRGLARAVVSRALAASKQAGNDLTFLLALRDDWPKELYRKLGFEEVGRIYQFRHPTPG